MLTGHISHHSYTEGTVGSIVSVPDLNVEVNALWWALDFTYIVCLCACSRFAETKSEPLDSRDAKERNTHQTASLSYLLTFATVLDVCVCVCVRRKVTRFDWICRSD